jgi:outer membrane protein assembly factor BamB
LRTALDTGLEAYASLIASDFVSHFYGSIILFIGSSDNQLYAIKAKTGATVWRGTTGAAIFNSPVIAKDVVYVTSSDDKLYAFAASTGLLLWNVSLGTNTHVFSPLVANGIVFTASSSTISAFTALTGTAIWSTPTDLFAVSTPVESDGVVYVTTGNGSGYNEVRGFDAKNGDLIWKFAANYISSPPSIVKQTLYVGGVDELFSININTRELNWNDAVVSGDVNSAPTIANGVVYANAGETTYAIDASSGTNLWSDKLNPNAILQSSPVVVNGFVYIGTINGLYTFHLSNVKGQLSMTPRRQKKRRIEQVYEQAEKAGIVQLNEDEAGPYQAIPQPGAKFATGRPSRRAAV